MRSTSHHTIFNMIQDKENGNDYSLSNLLLPNTFAETYDDDNDVLSSQLERSLAALYPTEIPEVEEVVQRGRQMAWFRSRCHSTVDAGENFEESTSTLSFDDEAPGVFMSVPPRLDSGRLGSSSTEMAPPTRSRSAKSVNVCR